MPDYFEIFGIERAFNIDQEQLSQKYFELQRQAHPDMAGGNAIQSSGLNNAYNTLKNRNKRAEYLMQGKALEADQGLLMEIMELREEHESNPQEVEAKVQAEIESLFAKFAENLDESTYIRIKYLLRFIEDVTANT